MSVVADCLAAYLAAKDDPRRAARRSVVAAATQRAKRARRNHREMLRARSTSTFHGEQSQPQEPA